MIVYMRDHHNKTKHSPPLSLTNSVRSSDHCVVKQLLCLSQPSHITVTKVKHEALEGELEQSPLTITTIQSTI